MASKNYTENLDSVDIQILRCLQQDARITIKDLSREVNLSASPVFERIKRMEREGYIKRYVTVLDAEKLHKGFIVFCSRGVLQDNPGHTGGDGVLQHLRPL